MSRRPVSFPGVGPGGTECTVAGLLDVPTSPRGVILMAHCFGCTKNAPHLHRLATELARLGYAVLRFDFYGVGETRGDFSWGSFDLDVANVAAAGEYLRGLGLTETARIGHSLGGLAVLAGATVPVVTIGTPSQPGHVLGLVHEGANVIGGKELVIGGAMVSSLRLADVADPGVPVLSIHSEDDEVVPFTQAQALRGRLARVDAVDLTGVDHMMTERAVPKTLAGTIATWLGKTYE